MKQLAEKKIQASANCIDLGSKTQLHLFVLGRFLDSQQRNCYNELRDRLIVIVGVDFRLRQLILVDLI